MKGPKPITFEQFVKKYNRLTFDKFGKPRHTKGIKDLFLRFADELLEHYNLDLFRCNNPKCKIDNWLGVSLLKLGELHHKNGITHDSRFKNLNMFCNNCHALTKGYKRRSADTEMLIEIEYGKEIFL